MPAPLRLTRLWVGWNAAAVVAGWLLSWWGLLTPIAWGVVLGLAALVTVLALRKHPVRLPTKVVLRRRWGRWPASGFLVLVVLSAIGGFLYEPNNIDALAYRTPRVLHWIAEGRWHWIPAPYQRLNTRACGFEWATVPIISLFRSDRPLFLLSLASFCLLPGLIFSSLRACGIGGRAAVVWMWLFPSGYCFVLQAGSIGNDLYGATLSAAALCLVLRARQSRSPILYGWALVTIGLVTGAKSSNIPLVLPWLAIGLPALRELLKRPCMAAACASVALACSLGPISWLNYQHTGDWTGLKAEDAWIRPPSPVACAIHNLGLLATQNILPPIVPAAGKLNSLVESSLPEGWKKLLDGFAENGRSAYAVRELPGEEHAGLGFGVTWLVIGSVLWGLVHRNSHAEQPKRRLATWLLILPWIALGPYLAKSGITTAGRILAPYYPWLLPGVLALGASQQAVRNRWFKAGAIASTLLTVLLLILLPSRPLWPARTVLSFLQRRSASLTLDRAMTVYDVYAKRADVFAPLRQWIPADSQWVGFVTVNDAEASLWKPFGKHRVRHLLASDRMEDLRARGLRCVVASSEDFAGRFRQPIEEWAAANGGRIVARTAIRLLAREPAREYVVVVW